MYCKLLNEVIKEEKGIELEEDLDVIIDINVSSFIPNSYIENNSQKIEVYQNIALCRTNQDISKVIEDTEDRYGKMPKEVVNLIGVARIKELCKKNGVYKLIQKSDNIVFYIKEKSFAKDVSKLIKKYQDRIKFSAGVIPYITYHLNSRDVIKEVEEFLK